MVTIEEYQLQRCGIVLQHCMPLSLFTAPGASMQELGLNLSILLNMTMRHAEQPYVFLSHGNFITRLTCTECACREAMICHVKLQWVAYLMSRQGTEMDHD